MLKINVVKVVIPIIVSFFLIGCEDTQSDDYTLLFNMQLFEDANGYYHLPLDTTNWQTIHRVTASVDAANFWVEWESNLYWYLGDTLGYIIRRNFDNYGQYVTVDTSYMIGFNGMEVSTTNIVSYSNSYGEINNMIAPIKTMIGDTMKLTANWYEGSTNFYIVLE